MVAVYQSVSTVRKIKRQKVENRERKIINWTLRIEIIEVEFRNEKTENNE